MNETVGSRPSRMSVSTKRLLSFLISFCFLVRFFLPSGALAKSEPLITTSDKLIQAIGDAQAGDVILVGDIDFTAKNGLFNKLMRISLRKNVTIKNGKKDGKAVFKNGSINLNGCKNASERLVCSFEGIVFDGGIEGKKLTEQDWELPYSVIEQEYTSDEPLMAQYAVSFGGNTDVSFYDCDFKNYMFSEGGAIRGYYGDYSADPALLAALGDYSGCTLNILLEKCGFYDNSAYYSGGAVYLDGLSQNVTLTAVDCCFTGNRSATNPYSIGGGAVYASGVKLSLNRCTIENNTANYLYSEKLPDVDTTQGGAVYCSDSELQMTNCIIANNAASVGGGIALINSKAEIDGCILAENKAEFHAVNSAGLTGPWNNMGLGGALYYSSVNVASVTIVNTSIYNNSAVNAYGGIYPFYNKEYSAVLPHGFGSISLLFCSYVENTCKNEYDYSSELLDWYQRPGDVFAIPYVKASGCMTIDDTFKKDFPRYEVPSRDNCYNYFASLQRAKADGLEVSGLSKSGYRHLLQETPENITWNIPDDFTVSVLNGRYSGEAKNLHVGSNYNAARYHQEKMINNTFLLITVSVIVIAGGFVILFILWRRKRAEKIIPVISENGRKTETEALAITEEGKETVSASVIRKQYTYEQIDEMLAIMPEAQLLTGREREVIRELLSGKQQLEVARELGIEVTTVKDFNRKIYDKFNVANKKKLLEKVDTFYRQKKS